ncbi:hypothetical protein COT75_00050 [Candidatus Beckwithbacteria bacterium CG10_big_fil_rev_8_21_14_0_10_34_10]|uniref:Glycosyltransferase 2-like domain-containing protein n=1 Tax=Candidatus Beckwithbacteria bacterium CG10_big_fil_rev_8_21_14_0_10_34_10 TaxID=1974495 RepID=A0A2H0WA95_9BACT|nr:MAG: hypothetical protein COT75_00050 [Candidatus Beckwithbacteria bacterium CG10_big_fil_rev_8_21_14_0_10_34_10]
MSSISVVIPVFNVGSIIKDCLQSVEWADELVCIDMGSTDNTMVVCKEQGVNLLKNIPKNYNFDINRKLGMINARGEWILKIDSDDRLTKKLQKSIKAAIKGKGSIVGYNLFNRVFFFNREIKYGMKKRNSSELRLFKKKSWIYNPFKFHQLIRVKGNTDYLEGNYLHFNSQSIREFINKMNLYTDLDAGKDSSLGKKASFLHLIISPIVKFIKIYIINLGLLDGAYGLIVSMLYAFYNFTYKLKIFEKKSFNLWV